jgi:peptide deformylase
VKFRDENWKEHEMKADGLFAECIQHEVDHLDGILFIDYLSPLKRRLALSKLKKARRAEEKKEN